VGEIDAFLKTGTPLPPPTPLDLLQCAREHLQLLWQYKGQKGIHQARKHMAWYVKGFEGAATLREQLCQIDSLAAGEACLERGMEGL
jgi:tRNA-dihydrouridine synthase B